MNVYDSIVVGGGPAGANAAYDMARAGLKVLVLEKERMPRYKCCGGGIPRKVAGALGFDISPCCEKAVRGTVFSWRARQRRRLESDKVLGWVVRREFFDRFLLQRAREAGADVEEGEELIGLEQGRGRVIARTRGREFSAGTLVGADGARSRVGRLLGLGGFLSFGFAVEARLFVPERILKERDEFLYFDFGAVPGGYAWIFPRRDHLSVGVATRRPRFRNYRDCLKSYLEDEGLAGKYSRAEVRGGLLPFGFPAAGLVKGVCLLTGAAAGLTDRLTGEGIYQALRSGQLAARAVRDFLAGDGEIKVYQSLVRQSLGGNLFWGNLLSRAMDVLPRLIFKRVLCDQKRVWRGIMVALGETDYKHLLFG